MIAVTIGIVTFLNLIVLKIKFEQDRIGDLTLDIAAILALNYMFGGTLMGMQIAMVASLLMSIYLYFYPPNFNL